MSYMRPLTKSDAERFWAKVDRSGEHWIFGRPDGRGYGRFQLGRMEGGGSWDAHRVGYVLQHGPIPDGAQVLHTCDVKRCVRHTYLGDYSQNLLDRSERDPLSWGRGSKVVNQWPKLLDEEKVREIRERRSRGETLRSLSESYGVAMNTIKGIVYRKTWKHVT